MLRPSEAMIAGEVAKQLGPFDGADRFADFISSKIGESGASGVRHDDADRGSGPPVRPLRQVRARDLGSAARVVVVGVGAAVDDVAAAVQT
jgi:hypothetical protein